jgi:hypothetical protein
MANTTNLTFVQPGQGNDYNLTYNNGQIDAFVGALQFKVGASSSLTNMFCVDLDHEITQGQSYSATPIQTNTLPSGNVYQVAGDILNAGIGSATDDNHAAALQLAIWSEIYGNSFSASGVSGTVQGYETAYYNAGLKTTSNALFYQGAPGSNGQSQITTTPEPASFAFLGIGLIGIFSTRKCRAKTA